MNSTYNNIDLASRFNELADKFETLFNRTKTILDFGECWVEEHPCGTVACHGGFGLCILQEQMTEEDKLHRAFDF